MYRKLPQLTDIPDGPYEGYLWYSDQQFPTQLPGEKFDFSQGTTKPFIIEAWLYSATQNRAILIRHCGSYQIYQYDLNQIPEGGKLKEIQFLPHRLKQIKKLRFQQLWLPQADPFCDGLEVLQAHALIFFGFLKN